MPSSIDKRIVEMDFDNARFEKNCAQSISTLDKLKNALNLGDAAKGFNQLEKQANAVDFSGLERSISNIESRFSALGIAGATIVSNLTNKAIGAVSKINNAVFGQMKSGGISRALNLEHANFMMEGLLKDSAKVAEVMSSNGPVQNAVRGTAYGLDAAANAAAQFIASGVTDMDKLENALTGISGVAAMTGASYEDMASIFTTVAGQGKVMTMQLRQIEARGLNAAAALGESLGKSEAEIRDMVTKGKISFEQFSEAMNKAFGDQAKKANETFTGAMSNVKAALSRIGAKVAAPTIEELRKTFVSLIGVVDNVSKVLDPLIEDINWVVAGLGEFTREILENEEFVRVYTNFIEGLRMVMYDLGSIIFPIKQAFTDVFPPKTLSQIADVFELFKRIVSVTYLSASSSEQLRRIFRGLFSIVDILGQAFGSVLKVMLIYSDQIGSFVYNVLEAAATVGDFFNGLRLWIKQSDIFTFMLLKMIDVIKNFKTFIENSFEDISKAVTPVLRVLAVKFIELKWSIEKLEGSVNILDKIKERFKGLTSIGKVFGAVLDGIKAVFKEISPIFKAFAEYVGNGIATLFSGIAEIVHSGKGFDSILDLLNTVIIGGIGAGIASFIDQIVNITKKSNTLIGNISWTFKELAGSLSVLQAKVKADMLASIAKSVGILTLSIIGLSLIDSDKLTKALMAITVLMGVLVGARVVLAKFIPVAEMAGDTWYQKILSPFNQTMQMAEQSNSILKLAAAIGILAVSLKLISTIDSKDMSRTLGAFVVLMVGLVTSAVILSKKAKKLAKVSDSILMLSGAIAVIAMAIKGLAKADPKGVAAGTIALGLVLGEIAYVLSKVKPPKKGDLMQTAGAISLVAVALGFMEPGLALLAAMKPERLLAGAGSLVAILTGISVALSKVKAPEGGDLFNTAAAISIIAVALGLLAPGLALLAVMDPVGIAVGFGTLALLLGEIGFILSKVNNDNMLEVAGGIAIVAASLRLLVPALAMLALIPLPNMGVALLGLAGSLALIGGAAFLLKKFELGPVLMEMGKGLLMISGSVALVGVGLMLIATSLGIIGVSGVAAAAGITAIMVAIGSALPNLFTGLALGIAAFIVALGAMAGSIGTAIGEILKGVIKAFEMAIPEFIKLVELTIIAIIEVINGITPVLIETALNIIDNLLVSIQAHVPSIVENLTLILIELMNALAYVISTYGDPFADAFINLFTAVINTLIASVLPKFLDFGMEILGAIVKGIFSVIGEFAKFVVELGGEFLKWIGVPEDWADKGVEFINGFIDGFLSKVGEAVDHIVQFGKDLIDGICGVLKIKSPSKIMEWVGEMVDIGAANGIDDNTHIPIESMGNLGDGLYNMLDSKLDDTEGMVGEHVDAIGKAIDKIEKRLTGLTRAQKKIIPTLSTESARSEKFQQKQKERTDATKEAAKAEEELSEALEKETKSTKKNSGGSSKNTKAKEENKKANDSKTKAINEESEALDNETESVEDNEQAIREQAEQIEVVTEKFNESLNYLGLRDPFKMAGKSISAIGKLWAQTADDSTNSLSNINKVYKDLLKTIPSSTDTIKRGLYAFNSETGKYLRKSKLTTQVTKSAKKIEKQVSKTGKTVAKVAQDTAKIFYKENGTVNKMTIGLTKNIKNLGKKFIEAKKFVKDFGDGFDKALKTETSEDFVRTFRTIENTFNGVANKKLPKQIQTYMKTVHEQFQDFDSSMSILSKRIGGTYDVMSKNSKVTPYVEDAFISLAATLYDGSEAANEYATEMARLEFLFENGLATEEEVAEKRRWYIDRIREALQEYKDTLDQTYTSQMDLWSAFDKHSLEEGTDVISNVESWIGGMKTFSDMSQVLSARLPKVAASSALITELLEEGFQGYGKMEALLKLTDAELALFVYDYQQAQDTIKNTADAALATIADSTTWASKRAAAASQDAAKRTLKFSKQVRAEQEDNIKAVARAMVENDKLRKKQEKKFLANLTKDQKKIYKAQKKEEKRLKKQADAQRKIHDEEVKRKQAEEAAQEAAEKAAQAEEEARQKAEEAKQAEEERVNTILEAIKTYENYYEAIKKYNGDVGVMTKLTEKLADALKPVAQYVSDISASSNDVRALISFTEALGNDGSEVSDVFSDINSKLESYISNIRNATKATNDFFNEVAEGSSISISEMLGNYVANTGNTTEFRRLLLQMSSLGYSADAINFIAEAYSSNRADTLAKMRLLVNATTEEIYAYNHVIENANEESKKAQQDAVTAARQNAEAVYKARIKAAEEESAKAKKAMESALSDVNTKKSVRDEVSNEIKRIDTEIEYATQYYNELKEKRDKLANAKTEAESDYKLLDKLVGTNNAKWLAQNDKKIAALIEKYGTSNVMSLRSQIENAYVMSRHRNSELDILENELKHADYHLNKLKDIQSNLKKHEAEAISNLNAAEKAYTESERAYAATVKAENDARNSYANEKERQDQLAREYLERQKVVKETLEQIISYETLIKVLRNTKIPAYAIVEVNKRLKDSFAELTDGIDAYGESFLGISKLSESTSDTLTETQFTFLKFAETLDKVSDETGDFFDDMSKRLKNYRDSLYDTIKGQVSLFDEFKKFSGETATSASTYLDNMASQLEGLEEWVEGMETLSKRGVSGDILDMFAQEGQASYEKVAAFVNATDAQLGELVSQYEKYKILTQKAADRTFAAVANSYSAASEKAMKNLLDTFQKNGIERFADATAEASAEAVQTSTKMIIEGIADGMSNAMPKIVEVATETGEILSETMTTAVATPETVTAMTENLTNTVSTASVSATTEMVDRFKMAVDSINQMIDENLNTDPVITPHIDTTEFDAAIARMNSAISSVQARAAQAQAAVSAASSASTTNNSQTSTSTTTINYTQNNTSPKALDQVELYRLTNSSLNRVLGLNGYTGKVVKK